MAKPVLLVTRKLTEAVEARAARNYEVRLNPDDRIHSPDDLVALAQGVDAILPCVTEHFTADLIARLPASLRIVASFSVGTDHIDLAAAKARGIVVTNTPDVLSDATAEIAMLLLLGAARRGAEGDRLVRAGEWKTWSPGFMVGVQVTGKRLGIVGMGRIGRIVAERARGFGMTVHYHNRTRLPPDLEMGAIWHDSLASLLPCSDFLSLHCPATPETVRLLNATAIERLPPVAVVVNTARGSLIDDAALIASLQSGRVAAAGLDVFDNEPSIDPRYRELPNVFMLPHVGSATRETRDAMGFRALDNLDAFFAGGAPRDRVA